MCSCSRITRGDPPRKSSTPIRAAEYFRPVHKLIGVKSVQKIETGLECDQRLLRKLKITVTGAHCATLLCEHSISQFSRQPLTPFEPSFDFPDRREHYKLMQRPKTFRRANRSLRFSWPVSSCMSNSNSHLSRQPHLLCNIGFVVLDHNQILERSYSLTIFIRAIQVRQI